MQDSKFEFKLGIPPIDFASLHIAVRLLFNELGLKWIRVALTIAISSGVLDTLLYFLLFLRPVRVSGIFILVSLVLLPVEVCRFIAIKLPSCLEHWPT